MTAADTARQIRTAYNTYATQYGAGTQMPIVEITYRTDLTLEQITEGIQHLNRTDDRFTCSPRSDQWNLTAEERACRAWVGNQPRDTVCWL